MTMIPTSQGPMSAEGIVDYLTYVNYRANRGYAPHITPAQWKKLYGPSTDAMEARYQAEIAIEKMRAA
jgi:hypothetical protein